VVVKDPDGRRWRVRRVLMSRRKVEDPLGDLPFDPIRTGVTGMAAGMTAMIETVALPFVVAFKVVFGRPFRVEAMPLDSPKDVESWQVPGLRASGRAAKGVRARIRAGGEPALPG
jgi:hypothetical protein